MKGIDPAIGTGFPAARQSWFQLRIGIELGEVVEQKGNDLSGGNVGGQGGIQRPGIVAEIVVEGTRTPWSRAGGEDESSCKQIWAHESVGAEPSGVDGARGGSRAVPNVDTAM